jgi:hypothetical protein
MGHGGHAGMSMDAMVRDMRNRFLVAALLSIPILLWSPIGREPWPTRRGRAPRQRSASCTPWVQDRHADRRQPSTAQRIRLPDWSASRRTTTR